MKSNWKTLLKSDAELTDRQRFEIRIRAKRYMRELLLICQKLGDEDKERIFLQPDRNLNENFYEKVTIPLFNELLNMRNYYLNPNKFTEDDARKIKSFIMTAHKINFPYVLARLLREPKYRKMKFQQIENWDGQP